MVNVSESEHHAQQVITQQIAAIRQTIPDQVRLIAVSKYVTSDLMRAAYAAGLRDFGENRIQDTSQKQVQLQDLPDIRWHMIGHLQRNKAKRAWDLFDWIHSVDSLPLAKHLNRIAADHPRSPQLCLQVKLRPDPQKYGWTVDQLQTDLPELQTLEHLNICGLMTILPLGLQQQEIFATFKATQALATQIETWTEHQWQLPNLSMGMSGDYPLAIEAGATMIRLGRCLFEQPLAASNS